MLTSEVQVIATLRRGDIRAPQLGGRRQWRIERAELEAYIQRCYEAAQVQMKQQHKTPGEASHIELGRRSRSALAKKGRVRPAMRAR